MPGTITLKPRSQHGLLEHPSGLSLSIGSRASARMRAALIRQVTCMSGPQTGSPHLEAVLILRLDGARIGERRPRRRRVAHPCRLSGEAATCGRTSAVRNAIVRPASSVVTATGCGRSVRPQPGAAAGAGESDLMLADSASSSIGPLRTRTASAGSFQKPTRAPRPMVVWLAL